MIEDAPEEEDDIVQHGRWRCDRRNKIEPLPSNLDAAYNASDSEEGYTVQWSEVSFSSTDNRQAFEYRLHMFKQVQHGNITRLYDFWRDTSREKDKNAREVVVFISEFMTSGSLRQYLTNTRKNHKTLQMKVWQRWCQQMLSALRLLHDCEPPIDHRKFTADNIYIQHTGLLKIGPAGLPGKRINKSNKPVRVYDKIVTDPNEIKELCKADISNFGLVALEMLTLEPPAENPTAALDSLDDAVYGKEKNFIRRCLQQRPSAHDLLFDPAVVKVPTLKKQAAHLFVEVAKKHNAKSESDFEDLQEKTMEKLLERYREGLNDKTKSCDGTATCRCFGVHVLHGKGNPYQSVASSMKMRENQLGVEKFLEDVRLGIFPLVILEGSRAPPTKLKLPSAPKDEPEEEHTTTTAATPNNAAAGEAVPSGAPLRLVPDSVPEVYVTPKSKQMLSFVIKYNLLDDSDPAKQRAVRRVIDFSKENGENLAKAIATNMVQHGLLHQQDQAVILKALTDEITASTSATISADPAFAATQPLTTLVEGVPLNTAPTGNPVGGVNTNNNNAGANVAGASTNNNAATTATTSNNNNNNNNSAVTNIYSGNAAPATAITSEANSSVPLSPSKTAYTTDIL